MFAFFLTLLIGPPLVSRDLTNNALPLYLCRPFSRAEYVVGKMAVLLILLSLITWVPGLLLFLFQAYLEGGGWIAANLWIAGAIFVGSLVWILAARAALAGALGVGQVADGGERGAVRHLLHPDRRSARSINEHLPHALGHLDQPADLDQDGVVEALRDFRHEIGRIERLRSGATVHELVMCEPPLWASWLVLL